MEQHCIYFGFAFNASAQNEANARRLSRYSEQKQCLAVCTSLHHSDMNYYQQAQQQQQQQQPIYKTQLVAQEKHLLARHSNEDVEYMQRYAVEPTGRYSPTQRVSFVGNLSAVDKMRLRHINCSNNAAQLSPSSCREHDSVYEEIDGTPDETGVSTQRCCRSAEEGSDSGIASPEPNVDVDGCCLRYSQVTDRKVNDFQTNL
ncbi:unnamed protein product [Anisakis simplex]|uniref:Teneurin-2 n=1 Tax=Anisakis simplex TaxID=6269 RepID=A0A0M3JCL1_ANISI|nr:unnamed protein product [Anisakis simplex]